MWGQACLYSHHFEAKARGLEPQTKVSLRKRAPNSLLNKKLKAKLASMKPKLWPRGNVSSTMFRKSLLYLFSNGKIVMFYQSGFLFVCFFCCCFFFSFFKETICEASRWHKPFGSKQSAPSPLNLSHAALWHSEQSICQFGTMVLKTSEQAGRCYRPRCQASTAGKLNWLTAESCVLAS